MTLTTFEFSRKTFDVNVVRVTPENLLEVAEWCGGEVLDCNPDKYSGNSVYIKVEVGRTTGPRANMAFINDWVLRTESVKKPGFKVYKDAAFKTTFEPKAQTKLF